MSNLHIRDGRRANFVVAGSVAFIASVISITGITPASAASRKISIIGATPTARAAARTSTTNSVSAIAAWKAIHDSPYAGLELVFSPYYPVGPGACPGVC